MDNTCSTKESCRIKMIKKVKESMPQLIGTIAGAAVGFMYYKFVGCSTGTCGIVSNPWLSTLVGGFLGFFVGNLISMREK